MRHPNMSHAVAFLSTALLGLSLGYNLLATPTSPEESSSFGSLPPGSERQLRSAASVPTRAQSSPWVGFPNRGQPHPHDGRAGCALSNVDVIVPFTGKRDVLNLENLYKSMMLFLPCYRKMHIIVPGGYDDEYLDVKTNIPSYLGNVFVHREFAPPTVKKQNMMLLKQWGNFYTENYTDAEYVMFMDSDSMFAYPLACQSMFDEKGKPYAYYWPDFNFAETDVVSKHLFGGFVGDFMVAFPQVYPTSMFVRLRKRVELVMKQVCECGILVVVGCGCGCACACGCACGCACASCGCGCLWRFISFLSLTLALLCSPALLFYIIFFKYIIVHYFIITNPSSRSRSMTPSSRCTSSTSTGPSRSSTCLATSWRCCTPASSAWCRCTAGGRRTPPASRACCLRPGCTWAGRKLQRRAVY
jgi:hypothetical protein